MKPAQAVWGFDQAPVIRDSQFSIHNSLEVGHGEKDGHGLRFLRDRGGARAGAPDRGERTGARDSRHPSVCGRARAGSFEAARPLLARPDRAGGRRRFRPRPPRRPENAKGLRSGVHLPDGPRPPHSAHAHLPRPDRARRRPRPVLQRAGTGAGDLRRARAAALARVARGGGAADPRPRQRQAQARGSGSNKFKHHSCTIVPGSQSPNPLGVPRPVSHGPAIGPAGISPGGMLSPHAVFGEASPPPAANSHSASVGRRQRPPAVSASHAQKVTASFQLTPVTGWRGARKSGSLHNGGASTRPAASSGAYSRLVTGVRPIRKGAISTVRFEPFESGRTSRPPGTATVSGITGVSPFAAVNPIPIAAVRYRMASVPDSRPTLRPRGTTFRKAALSTFVGVGVVFLSVFTRAELFGWRLASYGALCGLTIFICCRTLFALVGQPLLRREILPRPIVAAIVFFFGGGLGWGIASFIAQATGLARINFSARDIGLALGIAGSLGLLFGLVFYFFGALQERLRESVARLKEGTVGLVVADVSGKGIGAALIIANAGLPDPYRVSGGARVEALSVPGPRLPLGARREVAYEELRTAVALGERILFLTDRLPEALDAAGEPLGYEALSGLIASAAGGPRRFPRPARHIGSCRYGGHSPGRVDGASPRA